MVHIRKFEEINEAKKSFDLKTSVLNKLSSGYSVCVYRRNFDKFLDLVSDVDFIKFNRDKFPTSDIGTIINPKEGEPDFQLEKLYFILVGNQLMYLPSPKIGNNSLMNYIPDFD